jgi:hypothetical protein
VASLALAAPLGAGAETAEITRPAQVLAIALREARHARDRHPRSIVMASGSFTAAVRVADSGQATPPSGSEPAGDADSVVYLVAMRGYFHYDGPIPPHERVPPHRVLELIIDKDGFVENQSWRSKVPVPLSSLGTVTRLYRDGKSLVGR